MLQLSYIQDKMEALEELFVGVGREVTEAKKPNPITTLEEKTPMQHVEELYALFKVQREAASKKKEPIKRQEE